MRHLWRSASWGSSRGHVCAVRAVSSIEEPRDGSTPSKDVRLRHCGCHDKVRRAAAYKIETIGQVQPIVHAPQPATDGMATGQKPRRASISGNCQRGRSLRRAASSGWLHDLDSRQAALPTGINEGIARPRGALRRAAPLMAIAISAGSRIGQDQAGARFRPPCSSRLGLGPSATWLEIASIKAGDRQS
mgnify:CR=1 FL=1